MIPPTHFKSAKLLAKDGDACMFRVGEQEFVVPKREVWTPPPEAMKVGNSYDIEVDGWWHHRNRAALPEDY
jgi:hypothetical protein